MIKKQLIASIIFVCFANFCLGQQPKKANAVEIYAQIQKLNFLGSVLYVAAHPDDENTRLISYLSNETKARTGYLSLTRGDGGQNLIGTELRELLGSIRTQELIEARKVDGGEQFFSRANDFGFSKNPDETLSIWDKNEVLSDVVWQIRQFQPDIIINRFDHRSPGTTHGHHTASAMLSVESFDLTNDKKTFENQMSLVNIWQPQRIFFNTSWWFFGSQEKFDKADKTNLMTLKTGVYYESLGKSNQEIAALSRSCHQSQGFGSSGSRGEETEYLELIKGDMPKNTSNIFDGIDTTWNRLKGGAEIGLILSNVEKNFNFKNPENAIPELVKAYVLIEKLENTHWKKIKIESIKKIITSCAGLYLEAVAEKQEITPGSNLKLKLEAINRSSVKMNWENVDVLPEHKMISQNIVLSTNEDKKIEIEITIPEKQAFTDPYWLKEKGTVGMYAVNNQSAIGIPDIIRTLKIVFNVKINDVLIPFEREIIFKYNDEVKGETYKPLDVVPIITASFVDKVKIFNSKKVKTIGVKVKAGKDNLQGELSLELSKDWEVSPKSIAFELDKKDSESVYYFEVIALENAHEIEAKAIVTINNERFDKEQIKIKYDHIVNHQILKPATSTFLKLNIKTGNEKIAYIMGAGDEVPEYLSQMGYEVEILKPENISKEKLKNFNVVITGIRAYNTIEELSFKNALLLDFVKEGNTMIVQYNTTGKFIMKDFCPFPLKISSDRVTEETAKVRFLDSKNNVLNYPNKLSEKDFEGWVQEQGLYYPSEWSKEYKTVISSNDRNEKPKDSAILIANLGKGHYIYTGLSFFRELPAGVVGAFRLLANLISIKN